MVDAALTGRRVELCASQREVSAVALDSGRPLRRRRRSGRVRMSSVPRYDALIGRWAATAELAHLARAVNDHGNSPEVITEIPRLR